MPSSCVTASALALLNGPAVFPRPFGCTAGVDAGLLPDALAVACATGSGWNGAVLGPRLAEAAVTCLGPPLTPLPLLVLQWPRPPIPSARPADGRRQAAPRAQPFMVIWALHSGETGREA